jgi:hypothetical protein
MPQRREAICSVRIELCATRRGGNDGGKNVGGHNDNDELKKLSMSTRDFQPREAAGVPSPKNPLGFVRPRPDRGSILIATKDMLISGTGHHEQR